jgi:hypothetical protein
MPHTIHRIPTQTVDEIKALRRKTTWCPHKIAGYRRTQGGPVGHEIVYRILRSSQLNRPLQTPRLKRTYTRWHPQIIDLLKALRKELGLSMILIAHDLSVLKELSDPVAILYAGKIVENASVDAIVNKPHHPYTKALLQALPQVEEADIA